MFQLRNIGIILLVLLPVVLFVLTTQLTMDSVPIDKEPYTHFNGLDPSREMYVSWETSSSTNASIKLGTSPENMLVNATNTTYSTMHRIKLTNLVANTRYYYNITSSSPSATYTSPVGTFQTAPVSALPFTAAFFSDPQQMWGTGHYGPIADAIAAQHGLSFVAGLGDLAEWPDSQADWNLFMHQGEGWMRQASFAPSMGNHDSTFNSVTGTYDDPGNLKYLKYFGYSYESGSWANHFFYSFNWSNVQFVIGEIGDGSQENISLMNQSGWFNETLGRGQDKAFRVLAFHRSLYSSIGSGVGLIERIKPIVEAYNVSLVIYGHDHHYERFLVDGHTYLCIGGAGAMEDTAFNIVPESQFINLGPSYMTLHFGIDRLVVDALSEKNSLIESVTLVHNGSSADLSR